MPDSKHKSELREHLASLHRVLEQAGGLDDATKESLKVVAADLTTMLDEPTHVDFWERLRSRWHDSILDFESQHPGLSQAVESISSILANAGI